MQLSIGNWLLAILPVAVLLGSILFLKWEAAKAGAAAWLVSLLAAGLFFGAGQRLLALASCKGVSLSISVLLIIWAAVFMYNVTDGAGAIKVIAATLVKVTEDGLLRCLLFAWCFISILQGLAGFGVPVAVVAPFLVLMGYPPITAVAACLVGHSWSISFGSMGSSYIAIQLVTGIPGQIIGPVMALLFSIPVFLTGFGVAHIHGGMAAVRRGAVYIVPAGAAITAGLWLMTSINAAQLATIVAAMCGSLVLAGYSLLEARRNGKLRRMNAGGRFLLMCAPYIILILLSIITQIPAVREAAQHVALGLDYPAVRTDMGHAVEAAAGYSSIQFLSHPAPILLVSTLLGYMLYARAIPVPAALLRAAAKATVNRCVPMSVGIFMMVMMALVMIDSGMTRMIAEGSAMVFQGYYGLIAPFVGMLGTFITGSNTNSNIMFGALQQQTALMLGKSGTLFAAAQSVGGSLGASMSPAHTMMGAANVGLNGQEQTIMRVTAKYCLASVFLTGLAVWAIS